MSISFNDTEPQGGIGMMCIGIFISQTTAHHVDIGQRVGQCLSQGKGLTRVGQKEELLKSFCVMHLLKDVRNLVGGNFLDDLEI